MTDAPNVSLPEHIVVTVNANVTVLPVVNVLPSTVPEKPITTNVATAAVAAIVNAASSVLKSATLSTVPTTATVVQVVPAIQAPMSQQRLRQITEALALMASESAVSREKEKLDELKTELHAIELVGGEDASSAQATRMSARLGKMLARLEVHVEKVFDRNDIGG